MAIEFFDLQVIIVGFVASRYNQPRMLGWGVIGLVLASVIMVMPHLLVGRYQPKYYPPAVCMDERGESTAF